MDCLRSQAHSEHPGNQRLGTDDIIELDDTSYRADILDGATERALRDPWVVRDPDGNSWWMYFTARGMQFDDCLRQGVIGCARSDDLVHWRAIEPAYEGGLFSEMETPQVFEHDGLWYCLFCVRREAWSEVASATLGRAPCQGNHYLVAESPAGPWRLADLPLLDADHPCDRYAVRMLQQGAGDMSLIGFLDGLGEGCESGTLSDPVSLRVDRSGRLVIDDAMVTAPGNDSSRLME